MDPSCETVEVRAMGRQSNYSLLRGAQLLLKTRCQ